MTNIKKCNKGFTLIELIIAIAMLAFLMTAVSIFMTSGIVSYKGAKADIRVHNSAQEVYDKLSDAVMEAQDIYIFGYITGSDKLYCFMKNKHDKANATDQSTADYNTVTSIKSMIGESSFLADADSIEIKYFEDNPVADIQVKALVVDSSVPIMQEDFEDSSSVIPAGNSKYKNQLTKNNVEINEKKILYIVDEDGNPELDDEGHKIECGRIYDVNDTVRQMFIFEDENMYYMTKYAFATANDDNLVDAIAKHMDVSKEDYLYSTSLDIKNNKTDVSAKIDVDSASVSIKLNYSDRNMTYKTNGMIKFRNSFVLRAKK